MTIRILPPQVAARIAAGEVVERPASVVKELLDNALDSGADQVQVNVTANRIIVIDNGVGILPDDLGLALERHATSKLETDDIHDVKTLGYRGEALPSIAAVADLIIVSRVSGSDCAFMVTSVSGEKKRPRPYAGSYGTRVEVYDLFHRHPARRKFQKSQRTEAAAIRDVIASAALCRPGVDFRFTVFGTEGRYPSREGLSQRAADVLGKSFSSDAVPFVHDRDRIRIEGLACLPAASRSDSSGIRVAVNGRPVADRVVRAAVRSAYASLIGPGRHPQAFISVTVPPHEVDVNIHPRKAEVRFAKPDEVAAAVSEGVSSALAVAGLASPSSIPDLARKLSLAEPAAAGDRRRLPLGRFIGQANGSWIISETMDGIVIIDQHAAHERVILERLKASAPHLTDSIFELPEPFVHETTDMEAAAVHDCSGILESMGFTIEAGLNSVTLKRLPAVLSDCPLGDLCCQIVRSASDGLAAGLMREVLWEKLANAACKAAIKAGEYLSEERADTLLREIEATPNASVCNHGRPTVAFLTGADLGKLFART